MLEKKQWLCEPIILFGVSSLPHNKWNEEPECGLQEASSALLQQQLHKFSGQKHMGPGAQPPAGARDRNVDTVLCRKLCRSETRQQKGLKKKKSLAGFSHLWGQPLPLDPKNRICLSLQVCSLLCRSRLSFTSALGSNNQALGSALSWAPTAGQEMC